MENHRKFLRTALFSEKSVVSYRLLSRKLKVHVNQAKEMLYDFHTTENGRKPNCVHATYIVTGFRKPRPSVKGKGGGDGESKDMEMQCSPFDSSFPGTQTTIPSEGEKRKEKGGKLMFRVVELCQEEELDAAKAEFEKVLSVHVYSLEPVPLKDLSTLTGCSADVLEIIQKEDLLKMGATYGTVLNPGTKRTGSRAPPPESDPKKSTLAVQVERREVVPKKEIKPEQKDTKPKEPEAGVDRKEKKPATKISTIPAKKTAILAAAKPKRGQSNLFTSWGNAPKKSAEAASESNSAAQSPKTGYEPDVKMESDDDDDDEADDEPPPPARDNAEDIKKRKERDDELRKMMDDDGDGDIEMEDDELPTEATKIESSPEVEEPGGTIIDVASAGGRRRGRRKIMKKVQSRDDEGYLVTKTEAAWESFSEDEPEPPRKPKPKAHVKGKKGVATGQGNITSFFAKK